MWESQEAMREITSRIERWNEQSEELFKIGRPNENMEFFGVVRFYFHGPDDKYHSKCVRISSLATARHLVNVLVEKFHPDLRQLKAGKYALYEYHPSSGERRLAADERPLVSQLYWNGDPREGQFLLRDEARSLPTPGKQRQQPAEVGGIAKWRSAGNLLGDNSHTASLQPNQIRTKGSVAGSSDELFFPTESKSKSLKGKKSKQKHKGNADEGASSSRLWNAKKMKKDSKGRGSDDTGQAVIRTASMPNFFENEVPSGAQQSADAGGTLTIFLDDCGLPDAHRQLKSSVSESAQQLINRLLTIYGLNAQDFESNQYFLQQINIPANHERLPLNVPAQVHLHPDDRPLQIMRRSMALYPNIRTELHLMNAQDAGAMVDDASSQQYVNIPQQRKTSDSGDDDEVLEEEKEISRDGSRTTPSVQRHPGLPCLVEVNPDGSLKHNRGLQFVLLGLVHSKEGSHRGGTPIKIGSARNAVGPTPNILIDSSKYPDIRPVHCSLLPNTAATRSGDRSAVLISPALDISSRPPGLAPVFLNGRKVTGPTPISEGAVIRLGRHLNLRYIEQPAGASALASAAVEINKQRSAMSGSTPALVSRTPGDVHQRSATLEPQPNSNAVVRSAKASIKEYKQRAATVSTNGVIGGTKVTQLWTDLLPICVDITLPETTTYQRASKSEFAAEFHEACCDTIDVILEVARNLAEKSAMPAGGADARLPPTRRPPLFVLTPAFMLYAVLRSCLRRWRAVKLPEDHREHYLTGVLNHMGSQVFQSAQTLPETADGTQATRAVISHMMFWLANASELLNFIRNDEDLLMHASNGTTKNSTNYRPDGPSVCDGVSLLERAIDFTFHELQRLLLECVEQLVPSILFPGDFDLQDDVRLDDRPRNFLWDAGPNPEAGVQRLLQALSYLMLSLRQACVNVSFAFQLFAVIFHALGAWIFNAIVAAGEGKQSARGRLPPGGAMWLTKLGAGRLMRRLHRMKQWADRHGLEQTFEGHFQLPMQTCLLLTCDRSRFQPFHRRVLELRALNSKRIEWLLAHLGDPPSLPQEWINSILKSAREELDGEQVYANRSSRGREILAVREDPELKLPLLIPPSGYAATSGLIGVPEGFMETIEPLVQDGYIRVRRNEAAYVTPVNGKWTGHLVVQDTQDHPKTVGFGSPLERGASQQSINVISRGPSMGNLKHEKLNLEKLAQRVGVKLSSIVEMVLKKGNTGLGLSIVAAKPEGNAPYGIYVRQVVVGGAAARDGRLETGDQILAIQNCPLIDCDQSEAVKMLAHNSTDQNGVHMVVAKRAAQSRGILNLINAGEDQSPVSARRRRHIKSALTAAPGGDSFGAMTRSTPCLNLASDRLDYDVSDEDDSDDSEDSGPRFGSRILPKGGSQPRRFKQQGAHSVPRHKSLEMLSSRPGAVYSGSQRAPRQESEPSSDDVSEEGSDHVWRQEGSVESLLNPDHVDSAKRKTESLKKVGVELPVTKSQLQQFNMRRQQNNTDSERTDRMSSDSSPHQKQGRNGWQKPKPADIAEVGKEDEEEEAETSSPDWSDFARHNAEARSRVPNKARGKGDSPSPLDSAGGAGGGSGSGGSKALESNSNTSEDSFIAHKSPEAPQPLRTKPAIAPKPMVRRSRQMQPNETEQKKKEDDVYSMPSDEAIYAPAEDSSTTGSEDLLNSRPRIVSGGRTKETETPTVAAAEESQSVKTVSVSDKALQTTNDFIVQSPEKVKQTVQTGTIPMLNSAVQTDSPAQEPVQSPTMAPTPTPSDASTALPFYRPPLDRLPTTPTPQPQISVETASPSSGPQAELKHSLLPQATTSGPADLGQGKVSPAPKTEFNLPWGGPYPSPAEMNRLHRTSAEAAQRSQTGPPYLGYLRSVVGGGGEGMPPASSTSSVIYWAAPVDGRGRSGQRSPSPPPVPTADFPQYHPPAYLEPAEWPRQSPRPAWSPPISPTSKWPVLRAPASERSGPSTVLIPDPMAVVHGPPASHSLADPSTRQSPSREVSPRRPDDTDYVRSVAPSAAVMQRLQTSVQPKLKPKSWIRSDEGPIFSSTADIMDGFEKERLEIIRMQEQRARMREEQLNLRPAAEHKPKSTSPRDVHQFSRIPPHVDTNPTYENCSGLSKYTNQYFGSRESAKSRESVALSDRTSGLLVRGSELRWSKKSVTFDEQPATVSVYTPPGTPHESLSEGAMTQRDHESGHIENQPLNLRPQRNLLDTRTTDERLLRSATYDKTYSKPSTQELTSQTQVMDINQVKNAEKLPFKEKMKLFAQAIGEEEPKPRLKASSRELHLLKTVVR